MINKQRSDSLAGALNNAKEAAKGLPLSWPSDVTVPANAAKAMLVFNELQRGRSRSHWKPHHARMLADVACLQATIDNSIVMLNEQGPLAPDGKRNPLIDVVATLNAQRTQILKNAGLTGARAEQDRDAVAQNEFIDQPKARSLLA